MKISNEARVGILTLIAIGVLIFGYTFLKGQKVFSRNNSYYAVYNKVDGLLESNPVLLNGFQVGLVESVYLKENDPTKVVVRFAVKKDLPVPDKSSLEIVSAGLLGDKALSLHLWTPESSQDRNTKVHYLASGDTLKGKDESGIFETAKEILTPYGNRADTIMRTLDSTLLALNKLLSSAEIKNIVRNIEQSTQVLTTTLHTADKLVNNLNTFSQNDLPKITQSAGSLMSNAESMTNDLKKNTPKISALMDNANQATANAKVLTEKMAKLDLEKTMSNLDKTMTEVNSLLAQVKDSKGSIGALLSDRKLYDNLNNLSQEANKFLTEFSENPQLYLHHSIGRRKKALEEKK